MVMSPVSCLRSQAFFFFVVKHTLILSKIQQCPYRLKLNLSVHLSEPRFSYCTLGLLDSAVLRPVSREGWGLSGLIAVEEGLQSLLLSSPTTMLLYFFCCCSLNVSFTLALFRPPSLGERNILYEGPCISNPIQHCFPKMQKVFFWVLASCFPWVYE